MKYNAQTIASQDAAAVKTAKHATTLAVTVLTKLKAAPKVRYGGPLPTHFSPPLTTKEVTELDAPSLDKQRCHEMAAREKALADKANKQCQEAAREKALANKANEGGRAAKKEKALADKANKQRRAAGRDKALADKANEQRHLELAECATTLATKALAKDEYNEEDDYVARRIEAYAALFLLALTPSWPKSEQWKTVSATGLRSVTSSLSRRTTKPQLQRCHHWHPRRPCRHSPTALSLMWTQSSLPWGGALKRHPLL